MKPVAIFRHSPSEGAGHFATFLDAHEITWNLIAVDAGAPIPDDPTAFSGLCFMGGPMSVNDDLRWIPPALRLIRAAVDQGVPVIGHCLGGQLMAKALGASVGPNPVKEIGWGEVCAVDEVLASRWLGELRRFDAFHWHGETFGLPEGAVLLLSGPHCANQAFALGPHLAMQCHVEMTAEMIRLWNRAWEAETGGRSSASVQAPQDMERDIDARVAALNRVADRLYTKWIEGLKT